MTQQYIIYDQATGNVKQIHNVSDHEDRLPSIEAALTKAGHVYLKQAPHINPHKIQSVDITKTPHTVKLKS